ncbi:MAG: transglutaminase-like domain-containing protein [Chloroflexota bacterium]|nr:transglutaminase-like domain-containing protein [Chloroflexota bacterium]
MQRWTGWLLILWTLFVLYPNPAHLVRSIQRAWSPPADPEAVQYLAAALPNDPQLIEAAVTNTLVPYAVPWQTYGVPWYFPTVADVQARGAGDCQARAVVLASILQAKGIPTRFVGSFDHLWVEYPGKHATVAENAGVAIVAQSEAGAYQFQWPQLVDWRASWAIERAYFWDPMPTGRRGLLVLGWVILLLPPILRRFSWPGWRPRVLDHPPRPLRIRADAASQRRTR